MPTENEIEIVNNTSRHSKALTQNAITPKYILEQFDPSISILDYGAGKKAVHTLSLREKGLNVTAYDIGQNTSNVHTTKALDKTYDLVFASNVINVQFSFNMLEYTLNQMFKASKQYILFNYPLSPRKGAMKNVKSKQLIDFIANKFDCTPAQVSGTNSAPLLQIVK